MKTLAIDASTKSSGIAIFQQGKLIHYECLTENDRNVYKRIDSMSNRIVEICEKYKPTNIVMEEVLPQDVRQNQAVYKALIYLQGETVTKLGILGYKVDFCVVGHWRRLCGIHTGPRVKRETLKANSQRLVKMIYNLDVNDDISDAICLGVAYIKQHKSAF